MDADVSANERRDTERDQGGEEMTQDEVIEMADKAGFFVKDKEAYSPSVQEDHELTPYLVAFANVVAQEVRDRIMFGSRDDWVLAEREACAKVAEQFEPDEKTSYVTYASTAIRARGQA